MSSAIKTRLIKLETSLTPKQAAIVWMEDAHRFESLPAYFAWLQPRPEADWPLHRLNDQVSAAVRSAMKGQPKDAVAQAEYQGVLDACFLFHLHQQVNHKVVEELKVHRLQAALLAREVRAMVTADAIRNELVGLRLFLGLDTAYPLDTQTAAAVEAAIQHEVETWESLSEQWTIGEWVQQHFLNQGKTELPEGAYSALASDGDQDDGDGIWTVFERPSVQALIDVFKVPTAFDDFRAGRDFRNGLADVGDAEFDQLQTAVENAIRESITAEGLAGCRVYLETVPMLYLRYAPLIERQWIDRYVVELAEWGAMLKARGFENRECDEHVLAWHSICPAGSDDPNPNEATAEQVRAVRQEARAHLAGSPGRTAKFSNREYLHFEDYRAWPGRQLQGDLEPEDGIVVSRWNAWVNATSGQGLELAGVQIGELNNLVRRSGFVVCDSADVAAKLQARRKRSLTTLSDRFYQLDYSTTLPHGTSRLVGAQEWKSHARDLLAELYLRAAAVEAINRTYFDGHQVLFRCSLEQLEGVTKWVEALVELYNNAIAARLRASAKAGLLAADDSGSERTSRAAQSTICFRLNPHEVKAAVTQRISEMVTSLVTWAKAETLYSMGDREGAMAVMSRFLD